MVKWVLLARRMRGVDASGTCYVSDVSILGSGNVIISNVLKCASSAHKDASSSITSCMGETYPSYGLVSAICLDCITEVMQSSIGNSCLPTCIEDLSSSDCSACTPSLIDEWTRACDQELTNPAESESNTDASADTPVEAVCTDGDKSLIQTGDMFVIPSLNCLKDLANFQTCFNAAVPYYNSITSGCKACASTTSTSDGIQAEDCGALCMQQPASSDACSECGQGIATSFDRMCLNLSTASADTPKGAWMSIPNRILFAVIGLIAAIVN